MITFCNQYKYIDDAINSCLSQEYDFPVELLIGLDGNDADSEKLINSYVEKYDFIKLFKIDNSALETISIEKASLNRSNLLKNARGEYICFLDGDDFYTDTTRFRELVGFLDENPDYIGVFHDISFFDDGSKTFFQPNLLSETSREYCISDYLKIHKVFTCFIYRNIFGGTVSGDLLVNDSTFSMYMIRSGKFYFLNKPMLAFRVGMTSIYNSLDKKKQLIYRLIAAEVNHKVLPESERILCGKYRGVIKKCFKVFTAQDIFTEAETRNILNFAKRYFCYFTCGLLLWHKLNILQKIKLHFFKFSYRAFRKNPVMNRDISEIFFK